MDNRPIGVFDSGLGGLTVVRELMKLLPQEKIVYFGDTGRVPYGSRSPQIIKRYAAEDCELLLTHNVKYIIAACGTVSSVADDVLKSLPVPAMGVVERAANAALTSTKNGRIGVIGTSVTVSSGSFERAIKQQQPTAQVFAQACPVLVTLVESGWIERDNAATATVAKRYLEPLIEESVDTLILGCTHFPLLAPILSDIMGDKVTLINAGEQAAAYCAAVLRENGMLADGQQVGECRFFVSDRPQGFTAVAEMFLGRAVSENIEHIRPEGMAE